MLPPLPSSLLICTLTASANLRIPASCVTPGLAECFIELKAGGMHRPSSSATMPQERFSDPEVIYMKREAAPSGAEAAQAATDDDGGVDDGIEDYRGSATKVSCLQNPGGGHAA